MPVMKRDFEISETTTLTVRQASGMERLHFETLLAKAFRKFRHFGPDQSKWTEQQQEEFLAHVEEQGGGMDDQIRRMVPPCIVEPKGFDINLLDSGELMTIYNFVRGEEQEGAVPLA